MQINEEGQTVESRLVTERRLSLERVLSLEKSSNDPIKNGITCCKVKAEVAEALPELAAFFSEAGNAGHGVAREHTKTQVCLLYTSPSPRDATLSRMPSSA